MRWTKGRRFILFYWGKLAAQVGKKWRAKKTETKNIQENENKHKQADKSKHRKAKRMDKQAHSLVEWGRLTTNKCMQGGKTKM